MTIGDRIREARKLKGLTQPQLAKLLNVTKQVVSNWERGYTPSIPVETIAALARALDITPNYILLTEAIAEKSESVVAEKHGDPYAVTIDKAKNNKIPPEEVDVIVDLLIKARESR